MRGPNPPHLLLASSNSMRMIQNLSHILDIGEISKITAEVDRNVVALFALGEYHFAFASSLGDHDWRQKVSRLYYAVYNVRRAVVLKSDGRYSTDSSDHQNVNILPDDIQSRETYAKKLKDLREDRNLADYSHLATVSDLVLEPGDALELASQFINDCRAFLRNQAVAL